MEEDWKHVLVRWASKLVLGFELRSRVGVKEEEGEDEGGMYGTEEKRASMSV